MSDSARDEATQANPSRELRDDAIQAKPLQSNGAHPRAVLSTDEPITDPFLSGVHKVLTVLASLKLTCVLFFLSILLVFLGTLAQVEMGLWTAVGSYFRWFYVWIPFQLLVIFGQKFFGVPEWVEISGSFPFPGGWTLGILMLINLFTAHALLLVRLLSAPGFRASMLLKRAGIFILHAGIVVLMIGEFVAAFQVEGIMTIEEGESSSYIQQPRHHELAVSREDGDVEHVVAIPASLLSQAARSGQRIQHPDLPFDLRVDEYMINSMIHEAKKGEPSRASAGDGTRFVVESRPEVSGTDTERDNIPAAYVTLMKKGTDEVLGTYLVSLWFSQAFSMPQRLSHDSQPYELSLRYQRSYKPYRFELLDFRFDRYLGTNTPKNYSSQVRIHDPELGETREVLIRMNEPLYYRGETFYQAGFNEKTERGTRLQVVHNVGWWLPYLACLLVCTGMLVHFSITLVGFLKQQTSRPVVELANPVWRFLPFGAVGLGLVYLLAVSQTPSEANDDFHLQEAGRLPVVEHGRVKPLDTLARSQLLIISSRQTYVDDDGKTQPAIRWLFDVMASGFKEGAANRPSLHIRAFRIENPQLLAFLGLAERRDHLYSYLELVGKRKELADEVERALGGKSQEEWNSYDRTLADLVSDIGPYEEYARYETPHKVFRIENDQVRSLLGLEARSGLRYGYGEFVPRISSLIREGVKARQVDAKGRDAYQAKLVELFRNVELYIELARMVDFKTIKTSPERLSQLLREAHQGPYLVPPLKEGEEWQPFLVALHGWARAGGKDSNPGVEAIGNMAITYAENLPGKFNQQLEEYQSTLQKELPDESWRARFETFFNRIQPFYQCLILYLMVLVVTKVAWLVQGFSGCDDRLAYVHRAMFWLVAMIFSLHTFAILGRMWIQERPAPVTNLYSSAVFIGWGSVILGLIIERLFHRGIGNYVASIMGFITCIIAHHLAAGGDTLEMMQAVLDTNFWLATHVTCVTFGYAATFVAGFFAIAFILMGVFTPLLNRDLFKSLSQIIYGILCFATFLSFTGTVLGGFWADVSWGRFWGWDPKENGALLIVVWNVLVLHARWSGWVKQRGVAVLALVGSMITAWSWFGTNQLGVGLHSYGFNETLSVCLRWFWLTHIGLIGIGLIPTSKWRSFGRDVSAIAGKQAA